MRILFLTTEAEDFLQDLVFHGLVTLLGAENVLDYPQLDRFRSPPPHDHRYQSMQYLGLPEAEHGGQSLEELLAEADAVIVGAIRGTARLNFLRVLELGTRRPIAALDGWDDPYVRAGIEKVDVYFKRETLVRSRWLRSRLPARKLYHAAQRRPDWLDPLRRQVAVATSHVEKLVPLPFGVIDQGFSPVSAKTYDIAFVGAPTSRERIELVAGLRRMKEEGRYRVYVPDDPDWHAQLWHEPTRLRWDEYMQLLSSSRICLSARGVGYDTYRYWEIPYAGSLLLSEPPHTFIPDNFVDGKEAVFAPAQQLCETAKRLLETDTAIVAAAGREKLQRFHTSVHRAATVLDRL